MIYEKNRPKNVIHLPTMPLWHETVNILYLGPLPRVILNPTIWCELCLKKIGSHACFQSEHFPPLRALNRHTFHLDSSSAHQPPLLNLNKSSQAPDPLLVSNACLFMVRLQKKFPSVSSSFICQLQTCPFSIVKCQQITIPSRPLKHLSASVFADGLPKCKRQRRFTFPARLY